MAAEVDDPIIPNIIVYDFCVDDCLTGGVRLDEAIQVRNKLIFALKKGGFEMIKWAANHIDLLKNIPGTSLIENKSEYLGENIVKIVYFGNHRLFII